MDVGGEGLAGAPQRHCINCGCMELFCFVSEEACMQADGRICQFPPPTLEHRDVGLVLLPSSPSTLVGVEVDVDAVCGVRPGTILAERRPIAELSDPEPAQESPQEKPSDPVQTAQPAEAIAEDHRPDGRDITPERCTAEHTTGATYIASA